VLQTFSADSSGKAIHFSYCKLEKLFITQQIQLFSILDTIFYKISHLILMYYFLYCNISYFLKRPLLALESESNYF